VLLDEFTKYIAFEKEKEQEARVEALKKEDIAGCLVSIWIPSKDPP